VSNTHIKYIKYSYYISLYFVIENYLDLQRETERERERERRRGKGRERERERERERWILEKRVIVLDFFLLYLIADYCC
jgi:hypothetical protein